MALVGQCGEPLPYITLQVLCHLVGGCHQGPEELGGDWVGLVGHEFCLRATSQKLAKH